MTRGGSRWAPVSPDFCLLLVFVLRVFEVCLVRSWAYLTVVSSPGESRNKHPFVAAARSPVQPSRSLGLVGGSRQGAWEYRWGVCDRPRAGWIRFSLFFGQGPTRRHTISDRLGVPRLPHSLWRGILSTSCLGHNSGSNPSATSSILPPAQISHGNDFRHLHCHH